MVSGLPDYTRQMTVIVVVDDQNRFMPTKAEFVTKKSTKGSGTAGVTINLAAPPDGEEIGLLQILASTDTDGTELQVQTLQSALWVSVISDILLSANKPVLITFPCWKPTQDEGDGSTVTMRIRLLGGCGVNSAAHILHFTEAV